MTSSYQQLIRKCIAKLDPLVSVENEDIENILQLYVKMATITKACWILVIWIIKYSILASYWRLFSTNRRLTRIFIRALAVFVTCWGIAAVRSGPLLLGGNFVATGFAGL